MMAMFAGVSGLKSQQSKLDVIGNNISNISTVAYKGQSVSFSDLLSQTLSGATASGSSTGGTNPMQVGLGVGVSSTTINMTNGSTQSTGTATDVSIGGNGFFIVQGGGAGEYQFTRAGNFGVDSSGNLTVDGYKVCGWSEYTADADGNYTFDTQKSVSALNLFSDSTNGNKKIIAPKATTSATLTGNLDPSATANGTALSTIDTTALPSTADGSATATIYDAQGNSYDVKVQLYKCYTDTSGTTPVTSYYWQVDPTTAADLGVANGSGFIEFDSNGKIVTTDATSFNTNPTITCTPSGTYAGAGSFSVALDFSGTSCYSSSSSSGISVSSVDGYAAGELQDFTIGSDGVITGIYSNSQKQPLGMIALANFNNPSGLQKLGGNLYSETVNSGGFTGGVAAGAGGTGSLSVGTLEMSNVDLSEQFSEMMIAQRAYQANSKVISTADEMMQAVINMKS